MFHTHTFENLIFNVVKLKLLWSCCEAVHDLEPCGWVLSLSIKNMLLPIIDTCKCSLLNFGAKKFPDQPDSPGDYQHFSSASVERLGCQIKFTMTMTNVDKNWDIFKFLKKTKKPNLRWIHKSCFLMLHVLPMVCVDFYEIFYVLQSGNLLPYACVCLVDSVCGITSAFCCGG